MRIQLPSSLNYVSLALIELLIVAPSISQAQTNPKEVMEQVEVTAEKRTTLLNATPDAITAMKGSKMIEIGLTEVADLVKLVPNATFTSNFGSSQLFVRGIGNTFITAGGDPGVATYTDGSYISDQTSANTSLFDLQRIEVLRGPQGALYGRNATGGAINLISASPTDTFKGQFNVLMGDYGRKDAEGFFSGPIGNGSTTARLSYQIKKMDGYTSNPLAGKTYPSVLPGGGSTVGPSKLDDVGSQSLRFQTMTDLGNYSKLRLIASYHRASNNGPSATPLVDPVMSSGLLYGVFPSTNPRVTNSQGAYNNVDVNALQAIYEMPIGKNTFKVTASMRDSKAGVFQDGDATEALVAGTRFTTSSKDKSIDAHIASDENSKLQWVIGSALLQFDQQQDIQVQSKAPLGFFQPGAPFNIPVPLEFLLGGKVRTQSSALYTDMRYSISPTLALRGGLRLNKDEKTATEYQTVAALGLAGKASPHAEWSSTPSNLGLEWKVSSDSLAYTKLSHGFKSGAINLGNLQPEAVKPETVRSLEIGAKTSILEKQGSLAVALFTSDYKNMQVSQVGLASVILTNASSAKINGLELEMLVRPVKTWTLGMNIGLMDPTYTNFINTNERVQPRAAVSVKGNQLANISKAQASLSAEWNESVGNYQLSARSDFIWRDSFYFTEFNTADTMQKAYGLLNLSGTIRPNGSAWKVYGQIRNATNTTALTSMTIASPLLLSARSVGYTPPRSVGVGVIVDF